MAHAPAAVVLAACAQLVSYPPPEPEVCGNGRDDDFDGATDCDDSDCRGQSGCVEAACDDGSDDDLDNLTDCADPDCDAACGERGPTCFDGRDNDGDRLVDHLDPDCWALAQVTAPSCATVEGGRVDLGAELGTDWSVAGARGPVEVVDRAWSSELCTSTRALLSRDGYNVVFQAVRPATGAVADTIIDANIVFADFDVTRAASWVDLSLGDSSSGELSVLLRVQQEGGAVVTLEVGERVARAGRLVFDAEGFADLDLRIRLEQDPSTGARTLRAAVRAAGGVETGALDGLPLPERWSAHESFDVRWSAYGGGIRCVRAERPLFERCRAPQPQFFEEPLVALSAAAVGERELCVAANGRLWAGALEGDALPSLSLVGTPEMPVVPGSVTALVWDAAVRRFRLVTREATSNARLYVAESCHGPWSGGVAAFDPEPAIPYEIRALAAAPDSYALLVQTGGFDMGMTPASLHVAHGDPERPGSFVLGQPVSFDDESSFDSFRASPVGPHFVMVRATAGSELVLTPGPSAASCQSRSCGAVVLPPSGEPGTFDRYGASAGLLAIDPATASGFLVYLSACPPASVGCPELGLSRLSVRPL